MPDALPHPARPCRICLLRLYLVSLVPCWGHRGLSDPQKPMFLPSCASFRSTSPMPPLPLDTGADTLLLPNSSLYLSPRRASQFIIIYTLVRLPPDEDDFETRIQEQVICLGDEPRKYPLWAVRQGRQPIKRILLSKLPPRALSFILLRNQHRTHTSVIPLEGCGSQGIYPSVPVSYWLPDALSSTDPLVLLLACSALRQRGRCWQLQVSRIYMMEGSRNYG